MTTACQEIVPFRRRGSALRPINSIKHIIDTDGTLLENGTNVSVTIAVTVPNTDSSTFSPGDIRLGGKINGFFISLFVLGASGAAIGASVNWYIIKHHANQGVDPDPSNTGVSPVRNQIFHQEKGLAGSGDGTPMAFKGVIVIPKGMRTMREGESFRIVLALNGLATSDANFCLKAIYKSFF